MLTIKWLSFQVRALRWLRNRSIDLHRWLRDATDRAEDRALDAMLAHTLKVAETENKASRGGE
jgi:hypothetical protein